MLSHTCIIYVCTWSLPEDSSTTESLLTGRTPGTRAATGSGSRPKSEDPPGHHCHRLQTPKKISTWLKKTKALKFKSKHDPARRLPTCGPTTEPRRPAPAPARWLSGAAGGQHRAREPQRAPPHTTQQHDVGVTLPARIRPSAAPQSGSRGGSRTRH